MHPRPIGGAARKFAQGAYVPPKAVAVDANENRRDATQDGRNNTINNVTGTCSLDAVSLQSAASTSERSGPSSAWRGPEPRTCVKVHPHRSYFLWSKRMQHVLLERLRGRNPARDVLPPPQTETSPPQHPESTIKNTAEPHRLHDLRKKTKRKSFHAMTLRPRPLKKPELYNYLENSCTGCKPLRQSPSKRRRTTSEDKPLVYFKMKSVAAQIVSIVTGNRPAPFLGFPVTEPKLAEKHREYLSRMDGALDDSNDLDNLSDEDYEPTVQNVSLNQRDIADQDRRTGSPNLSLACHWDSSGDVPMVRGDAAVKQVPRRTNDSPVPGPSGMQLQLRENNSDTDQDSDDDNTKERDTDQDSDDDNTKERDTDQDSDDDNTKERGSDRIRKERDIRRIKKIKKNDSFAEIARLEKRYEEMQKEKEKEIARLKEAIRVEVRAKWEAERRMNAEVDSLAKRLDKEKDAKTMNPGQSDLDEPGTGQSATEGGSLVDAPVFYPSLEEFEDPVSFFEKIYPSVIKFGICKVVPPQDWSPPSEVHGDIRFDSMNQYISRLFNRWGVAARELAAIKLCLQLHQNINLVQLPQWGGVEINLPKLYHLVQRLGGLESVIDKKRWGKVADDLRINKTGPFEKKFDEIYMKYLLPYDTLSHQERQEIMRKVEVSWNRKNQKLLDRAMNPLYRQQRMLGLLESSDEETEDENTRAALKQAEDCIVKGHLMRHSRFRKVASMAYENTFGPDSEAAAPPPLEQIEEQYWRIVTAGTEHVCVHTAAIDTGEEGHGFTTTAEPYASHPWNPKQVIKNPRNVLRYLGPVGGVTLPTLFLGMLFSTSCWHKDPHAVAWQEYQSLGPTRIWYGVAADQSDNFRKAVETVSPTSCQNKALWLSTQVAMISPSVLREHNVRLTRVEQNKKEFIIACPNAYTSCISTGYTESERVFFASQKWLPSMWLAFKTAQESCEPTMFSIENLLFNISRDKEAEQDLVERVLPLYDQMVRQEVTNRQMLQERGLPCEYKHRDQDEQQSRTDNARLLEECDYCRTLLFLSKVQGLPAQNSVLCLAHTLELLDQEKYKDTDVKQLQLLVYVSVKELYKVVDEMRRR